MIKKAVILSYYKMKFKDIIINISENSDREKFFSVSNVQTGRNTNIYEFEHFMLCMEQIYKNVCSDFGEYDSLTSRINESYNVRDIMEEFKIDKD